MSTSIVDLNGEKEMPDTGENREIRQRINAKEAEITSESRKLLRASKLPVQKRLGKRRRPAIDKKK